jgi:hypothetical protein
LEILRRELIPSDQVERWTKSFIMPDGKAWKDAYEDERRNKAYQNIRNLLRSIYLALTAQSGEYPNRERLMGLVFESISAIHR